MKLMKPMNLITLLSKTLALALMLALSSCAKRAATPLSSTQSYGNLTISSPTTWSHLQVTITGTLTITGAGSLTLDGTNLLFSSAVEDSSAFVITGGTFNVMNGSTIMSGTGKQWNLEASGACNISFSSSSATHHSGMRMHDSCTFVSDASAVEEVQVHDNASATINRGSSAYLVLFFTGGGSTINLTGGQVVSGNNITRNFTFPTSASTTGSVVISNSSITGFQLDLVNSVILNITNGTSIVLALHLNNVGNAGSLITNASNITSSNSLTGTVDFSAYAGPKFNYTTS